MKKLTVTLPEDAARWLGARAAEEGRGMSECLAALVEAARWREDEYDLATERLLAREPRELVWSDGRRPSRDELHDRPGLR